VIRNSRTFCDGIIFLKSYQKVMKKFILCILLLVAMLSFSCNNSNRNSGYKSRDSLSGNTDSAGSQPAEPAPGAAEPVPPAASSGNGTDTIAHELAQPPRTDSVVRH
jgi:hypothetical protein